jgi:hypothetical protein
MFVRLYCLLLFVGMTFLSPLAKAADPAFDSNTGKLVLSGLFSTAQSTASRLSWSTRSHSHSVWTWPA